MADDRTEISYTFYSVFFQIRGEDCVMHGGMWTAPVGKTRKGKRDEREKKKERWNKWVFEGVVVRVFRFHREKTE